MSRPALRWASSTDPGHGHRGRRLQVLYNRAMCFDLTMDNLPKACDILLDEHQFEIIKQKVVDRQDFQLEFDIRNHFFPGPMKYHNILGVIKGSKYPDEYVMMGSHLDAYDIATGSTDDGQGVCVSCSPR